MFKPSILPKRKNGGSLMHGLPFYFYFILGTKCAQAAITKQGIQNTEVFIKLFIAN